MNFYRNQGVDTLTALVYSDNKKASTFLEKNGFSHERFHYYKQFSLEEPYFQDSVLATLDLRKELVNKCAIHNARWVYSMAKIILDKDLLYRLLSRIWYAQVYFKDKTSSSKTHYIFPTSRQPVSSNS